MSTKITTRLGVPVPPAPRHSVTTHIPTWKDVESSADNSAAAVATYQIEYPLGQATNSLAAGTRPTSEIYKCSSRQNEKRNGECRQSGQTLPPTHYLSRPASSDSVSSQTSTTLFSLSTIPSGAGQISMS